MEDPKKTAPGSKPSSDPASARPAVPEAAVADAKLHVTVVFTSAEATVVALRRAVTLAAGLNTFVTIVFPQVVPYPLALDDPPVPLEFSTRRLSALAGGYPVETMIHICLCRDPLTALLSVLNPESLIVLGSLRRWWPTAEKRLARQLRRAGHNVIVAEKGKRVESCSMSSMS